MLKPAGLEFALELHFSIGHFNGHDDGGMRPIQEGGEQNAGLPETVIVALQTGEHQVALLLFDGGS